MPQSPQIEVSLKSILKASSESSPTSSPTRSSPARRSSNSGVHFKPPNDFEETLQGVANQSIGREKLDDFITHMKNQKGDALVEWLQRIQENLNHLKPSLETFVLAILGISWSDQEKPVITAFKNFLINLISAQSYYTKPVVKMLLYSMQGTKEIPQDPTIVQDAFKGAHEALQAAVRISPLAAHVAISTYSRACMPFMANFHVHVHANYITNLLKISQYLPDERAALLNCVLERLVQLDAELPIGEDLYGVDEEDEDREENTDKEDEENTMESSSTPQQRKKSRQESCRDNLDEGMRVLFDYIKAQCLELRNDPEAFEAFYRDLLQAFEVNVLPSYATGHVQYIIFYLASLCPEKISGLLDFFYKKFASFNTASILRQTSMSYIASLISRAKFIDSSILRSYLKRITDWIHLYLNNRTSDNDHCIVDLQAHGPFYAACQAVLYMLAFRYEELVQGPKSLQDLAKLRLSRIVTCSLNPLRVCLPPVVKNFASIARHYQLAYCETVIQKNSRLNLPVVGNMSSTTSVIGDAQPALLDTFFPFDPYRLNNSKRYLSDHYREYQGSLEPDEDEVDSDDNEDESDADELEDEEVEKPSAKRRRLNSSGSFIMAFEYEDSPGFLKIDPV